MNNNEEMKNSGDVFEPWLTIALSTTATKNHLLEKMILDLKQQSDYGFELLIVVQSGDIYATNEINQLASSVELPFPVRVKLLTGKGLLKSRNVALSEARGKYILLADDDCRYFPYSISRIKEKTIAFDDSDILTFQAVTTNGSFLNPRNNPSQDSTHSMKTIMSVCSIEIVVSRSLAKRNILFDERFGLGTDFSTGGENIMLLDALRQGVKITRHPAVIVQHPVSSSGSGSRGLSQLAFAKGAMFRRMFGFIGILLVVWFMLRSSLSDQPPRFSAKHYIHALSGFLKAPVYKVTRQEDD